MMNKKTLIENTNNSQFGYYCEYVVERILDKGERVHKDNVDYLINGKLFDVKATKEHSHRTYNPGKYPRTFHKTGHVIPGVGRINVILYDNIVSIHYDNELII